MNTRPGPWILTGFAAVQLLLGPVVLVLAILVVVSGFLAVITIGIPVLLLTLPGLRWAAQRHRSMAARTLGHPVPADHLPTAGLSLARRMVVWARDPMTWREIAWGLVAVPIAWVLSFITVVLLLAIVTSAFWWFSTPHIMWARASLDRWFLSKGHSERLEERVEVLIDSRSAAVDHAAAELRRVERDLHDGAQARLVALGMTLGLAEEALRKDPEAAAQLISEARNTGAAAVSDLRHVLRGIHPPVLSDRGLVGAVSALALDMGIPVAIESSTVERLPAPIESAVYFAVAECLANTGKHSRAANGWVRIEVQFDVLTVVVGDDGTGGADAKGGTGLRGVARRLNAFDGTMSVDSPRGGPTVITLEVPCGSSSPKTTPSCETV